MKFAKIFSHIAKNAPPRPAFNAWMGIVWWVTIVKIVCTNIITAINVMLTNV